MEIKIYNDGHKGDYFCECLCNVWFIGHKRDHTCPTCESKIPVQLDLELTDNNNKKGLYNDKLQKILQHNKQPQWTFPN